MTPKPTKSSRQSAFQRNDELEQMLELLNQSLVPAEELLTKGLVVERQSHPIVFIVGPLRSGTTLLTQWLAKTGIVACPTNLLSRFYQAPAIGALVQLLLTDPRYNFRNEILDFNAPIDFNSENGKTRGALAPNEFWYFWRRFLPFGEFDWLSDEELEGTVDKSGLVGELSALTKIFDKPFALKSMILNYNIPFLDRLFEKALFVQIKRDPVANVASILEARERQFGDEKTWYSFKIPEYSQLKDLGALPQSAGQLTYINRAVTQGMSMVDESRKMKVDYEEFCANPKIFYIQLMEKLGLVSEYTGPAKFNASKVLDRGRRSEIQHALDQFQN